jgi:hypothetical protein
LKPRIDDLKLRIDVLKRRIGALKLQMDDSKSGIAEISHYITTSYSRWAGSWRSASLLDGHPHAG